MVKQSEAREKMIKHNKILPIAHNTFKMAENEMVLQFSLLLTNSTLGTFRIKHLMNLICLTSFRFKSVQNALHSEIQKLLGGV